MPFIALCPHCRNSRFRAPESKRGETVRCPKCGVSFTLIPCEEMPADTWAATPAATAETQPAPSPQHAADEARQMTQYALGAVAVALVISQFPYGRMVAVFLALGGCMLAGLSLPALERRRWLAWSGIVVNAVLLAALVVFPSTLGLSGWLPETPTTVNEAPQEDEAEEWINAAESGWELDGVRVGITFANVAADPAKPGTKERYLWVGVKVTNLGKQPLDFSQWDLTTGNRPTLTTKTGTTIPGKQFVKPDAKKPIQPGKAAECVLVFDAPAADSGDLLIQLPGGAFGGGSVVRFRIPVTHISRQ